MLALWQEADRIELSNFEGRHFSLRDARCEPKPVQRPHPPIAIGGNGEKKTLLAVAKWAQHWNTTTGDIGEWKRKKDVLLQHCANVGRNPEGIECSVNIRYSPETGASAVADAAHKWAEAGADYAVINFSPPHTPEPLAAIATALEPLAG